MPPQATPEAPAWLAHGGHPGDMCHIPISPCPLCIAHPQCAAVLQVLPLLRKQDELEFKCTKIEEGEDRSDFFTLWSSAFNALK